jgi:hypothetical protein
VECIFVNSLLEDNASGGYGGALGVFTATASVNGCVLRDNRASSGGGAAFGSHSTVQAANLVCIDNSAAEGGGLQLHDYTTLDAVNTTLARNEIDVEPCQDGSNIVVACCYGPSDWTDV